MEVKYGLSSPCCFDYAVVTAVLTELRQQSTTIARVGGKDTERVTSELEETRQLVPARGIYPAAAY